MNYSRKNRHLMRNWGPDEPAPPSKMDYDSIDTRNLPEGKTLTAAIVRANVCRVCFTYYESRQLVPIFCCSELTIRPLASILNEYVSDMVTQEDGYPWVMCIPCATKLKECRVNRFSYIEAQNVINTYLDERRTRSQNSPGGLDRLNQQRRRRRRQAAAARRTDATNNLERG